MDHASYPVVADLGMLTHIDRFFFGERRCLSEHVVVNGRLAQIVDESREVEAVDFVLLESHDPAGGRSQERHSRSVVVKTWSVMEIESRKCLVHVLP